jgi:outer membrane protein TolC
MFQGKLLRLAGPVVCISLFLPLGWPALAEDAPTTTAQDGELQPLLRERRAVLHQAVRHVEEAYRSGQATLSSVIECQRELSCAELDLAATPRDRVVIYKRLVDQFAALEKVVEAQYQAGEATQLDLLKAKVARLQARIDLARAESETANTQPK